MNDEQRRLEIEIQKHQSQIYIQTYYELLLAYAAYKKL